VVEAAGTQAEIEAEAAGTQAEIEAETERAWCRRWCWSLRNWAGGLAFAPYYGVAVSPQTFRSRHLEEVTSRRRRNHRRRGGT